MKQTSNLTRDLTDAQELHAAEHRLNAVHNVHNVYRLYVGVNDVPGIGMLLADKQVNATVYSARGSWAGQYEPSTVVEIIAFGGVLADVLELARELRTRYAESSVLVTRGTVNVWSVE